MKRVLSVLLCLVMCLTYVTVIPVSSADTSSLKPVPTIQGETKRQTKELLLPDGTGSGVMWTQINLSGHYGDDRLVNVTQVDLSNTHLSFEAFTCGNYITSKQKLAVAAQSYDEAHTDQHVLAAVNGDLWVVDSYPNTTTAHLYATLGTLINDYEIWASQQIDQEVFGVGDKACFGITGENQPLVGSPKVSVAISNGGSTIKADGINRLPANNALIVFNHRINSSNYAMSDSYEIELEVIEGTSAFYAGGTIQAKVVAIYEPNSSTRPSLSDSKTIVLTARGNRIADVQGKFAVGNTVTLSTTLTDSWGRTDLWQNVKEAMGGHMQPIIDGEPAQLNGETTKYPTALIGYNDDGTVMIVTFTSTKDKSRDALVLNQSYEFCKEMGYNSVFFLDGGGSTTFLTVENGEYTVRHKCSDGSERSITSGIALVWNDEPVCEKQGSLDYIKAPVNLSKYPASHIDGALLYELVNSPNAVDLSYSEEEKAFCMTTNQATIDPYASLQFLRLAPIMAEKAPYIVMKVKTDNPNPTNFCFYYATGSNNGASGSRVKVFPIQGASAGWQYVIVDMTTQSDWSGQVNYIRLDAFDSVATPANTSLYIGSLTLCSTLEEAQKVSQGQLPAGSVPDYLEWLANPPIEEEPPEEPEIEIPIENLESTLIYKNTFDSQADVTKTGDYVIGTPVIEDTTNTKYKSDGGGMLYVYGKSSNYDGPSSWKTTIDISDTTQKVTITMRIAGSFNKGSYTSIVSINGKGILQNKTSGSTGSLNIYNPSNSTTTSLGAVTDTIKNTSQGLYITVIYDINTGWADVTCEDKGAGKDPITMVVELGVPATEGQLDIKFGDCHRYPMYVDDLCVYTYALPKQEPDVASAMWIDGYQKTVVKNGVYNARFVVVIKELFEGQNNVGVEITTTAGGGKSWDLFTNKVHRSITANFGTESVTATERGGQYITAAAITGVPESEGPIEFVITPYATIDGVKVYGEAKTVTVDPAA